MPESDTPPAAPKTGLAALPRNVWAVTAASFLTDILGKTGRELLAALIAGDADPEKLVSLTDGRRLKASRQDLVEALRGKVTEHHRFLLRLHLHQIDTLQEAVRELEARMGEALRPFQDDVDRLKEMPGVSDVVAQVIAGEVGLDVTRFPTAAYLISWAGLCPRMDESAGKRRSTRLRKGAPWLKTTLAQAAWAAVRTKASYFRAQFLRLKSRRGPKKAILAVAAAMLTSAYYVLRDKVGFRDLGADYFERRDKDKLARRLVRRLQDLGLTVEIQATA